MLDRFQITMKLVEAGCDLRRLDPEVIDLIERQNVASEKKSSASTYSEIAATAAMYEAKSSFYLVERDNLIDAAINRRDADIRKVFRYLSNDGSEVYRKLAALIAEL